MISITIIESSIEVAIAGVELARKTNAKDLRLMGLRAARDAMTRAINYVHSAPVVYQSFEWMRWAVNQRNRIVIAIKKPSTKLDDILDRHEHFTNTIRNVRSA